MLDHETVTLALGRLQQDFQYFQGSLSYIMSSELTGNRVRPVPKRKRRGKRRRREREEDRRGGSKKRWNRKEGERGGDGGSGRGK